jgi:PTS system nitrogen regulatory IIA component
MEDHDILTIDEVALYLRVSERTIYDWANKGSIPCGKLGTTWRFKREEVEKWVDEKLSGNVESKTPENVTIQDVLTPDRILLTEADTKESILEALATCLGECESVSDPEALRKEIFIREELMSTGIGFSVAVPHVRLDCVSELVMAVGISRVDITDYDSLDEQPVRIVCMLAARSDQHAQYLKTLGLVSAALKSKDVRDSLMEAPDQNSAYLILTQ